MAKIPAIDIPLPHNGWHPRAHQEALWGYLEGGGKRAMAIWHRRAGKDEVCLHFAAVAAMTRPGNYWHCLPEYAQGRKAIWQGINAHTGKRRIDEAFPERIRKDCNDNEMFLRFINGSTWQIIGADRYDATVGSGVAGITYSEWALSNPSAWAYHRPMLQENNGWGIFITTPRGHNHAKMMFDHASRSNDWFCELLTARDTKQLSDEVLNDALAEYVSLYGADLGRAQFEQEYLCSFNAAVLGAFYALEMAEVRAEGRITPVEALCAPVHRAWDLGTRDDTSIWFFQPVGSQVFVLDHYAASGAGLEHYRDVIARKHAEHGWIHGTDFVPHDAKVMELGSGRTRIETMHSLGLSPMMAPHVSLADGINAVRRTLPLCVFHPRCEETGLKALEQYRREWDDEKKCFRASPIHDWTSDVADSFRYLCLSWRPAPLREIKKPKISGWTIPPPPEPQRGRMQL